VTWLREVLDLGPGRKALEVGAGTGKFIPILQQTGCRIIALEPIPEMREQLVRTHPDVLTLAGLADAIPLPDASVHAVVCAQAFHLRNACRGCRMRHAFPAPGLAPIGERHVRNSHVGTAEDVVLKRTLSVSFISALPSGERSRWNAKCAGSSRGRLRWPTAKWSPFHTRPACMPIAGFDPTPVSRIPSMAPKSHAPVDPGRSFCRHQLPNRRAKTVTP
jgi:SAM-dependent methyltransferase